MSRFAGKNVSSFTLVKSGASADGEVDAVSGATVTSTAVVNAVNAGVDFYLKTLKGGN
ncbi:MAG: FMN-binding protein [Oscillospiraceae bacterium]|nr:FMN-binding protein [Oscillospiraceae bacterium]